MENTSRFRKLSVEELEDSWKIFFSDFFPSFEDYVAEVRKIESDLQAEWIMQIELIKVANYKRLYRS